MIGYKGFDKDFKCRGYQYEVGKTYEHGGRIDLCKSGFHFCRAMADVFNYYTDANCRYAEIEALGTVEEGGDKCVTDKIRIIREIPRGEAVEMSNAGNWNAGNRNAGNRNAGNRNTGNGNTGNWNTGNWNAGNRNTGNRNTGNWNAGNRNTGNWNAGNGNAGNWNAGNWNTGDWNKSNYNSGCFMTIEATIPLFNKESEWTLQDWWKSDARGILMGMPQDIDIIEWVTAGEMTDAEKKEHPEYGTIGGYLYVDKSTADKQAWWDELGDQDKATVKALPNFDADIFKEVTGIEVK